MSINEAQKGILVVSLCQKTNLHFVLDIFPNSMLEASRAFSIHCPRQLLHLSFSLLMAPGKTCTPNCNVSSKQILFQQCDLHGFWAAQILLAVSWIHEIPLFNHFSFWISFHFRSLASHFRDAKINSCTAWLAPWVLPVFSSHF